VPLDTGRSKLSTKLLKYAGHTFATRALSAGVDVMALQRALGHTTLAMVSRHAHYQRDDLLEAWRRRRD
jgi:integrase